MKRVVMQTFKIANEYAKIKDNIRKILDKYSDKIFGKAISFDENGNLNPGSPPNTEIINNIMKHL